MPSWTRVHRGGRLLRKIAIVHSVYHYSKHSNGQETKASPEQAPFETNTWQLFLMGAPPNYRASPLPLIIQVAIRWARWPRISWLLMTRVLRSSSSLATVTTTEVRPHFRFFLGHLPPLWSPHRKTCYWWVCDLGFPTYLILGTIPEELQLFYDKLHKIPNLLLSWTHPHGTGPTALFHNIRHVPRCPVTPWGNSPVLVH